MGYHLNRLDEPVLIAVSKTMVTDFGIHHRLESCDRLIDTIPMITSTFVWFQVGFPISLWISILKRTRLTACSVGITLMTPFSWQGENHCWQSFTFVIDRTLEGCDHECIQKSTLESCNYYLFLRTLRFWAASNNSNRCHKNGDLTFFPLLSSLQKRKCSYLGPPNSEIVKNQDDA